MKNYILKLKTVNNAIYAFFFAILFQVASSCNSSALQDDVSVIEIKSSELRTEILNYNSRHYTIYKVKGEMSNSDYNSS